MKRLLLFGVILVLFSGFVNAELSDNTIRTLDDCVVESSCPVGYESFLELSSEDNAHCALDGAGGPGYLDLCCEDDLNQDLSFVPLSLRNNNNSHVSHYPTSIYGLNGIVFPSNVYCVLRHAGVCNDDVEFCVLEFSAYSNAHVAECGSQSFPDVRALCCGVDGEIEDEDTSCEDDLLGYCDTCPLGYVQVGEHEEADDCDPCLDCVPEGGITDCSIDEGHECEQDSHCVELYDDGYACDTSSCSCYELGEDDEEGGYGGDNCLGLYTLSSECLSCDDPQGPGDCGAADGFILEENFVYTLTSCDEDLGLATCLQQPSTCEQVFTTNDQLCFMNVDEEVPFFDNLSIVLALVLISSYYLYDRKRKDL